MHKSIDNHSYSEKKYACFCVFFPFSSFFSLFRPNFMHNLMNMHFHALMGSLLRFPRFKRILLLLIPRLEVPMKTLLYGDCFPRLWQDLCQHPGKWCARFIFLLGPWFSFASVELLNQNHLIDDFAPWQVLFNLIWYYILFFLFRVVLGRRRVSGISASLVCFAFGLVNHYVLRFRGRILFPSDLSTWRTAINVADGFDFSPDLHMTQAALLVVAYLFLLAVCPGQKSRPPMNRTTAGLTAACLLYTGCFFFTPMLPALNIYTQQWTTQENGFLLNFTTALRYSIVRPPAGYNAENVEELTHRFSAREADPQAIRPVNLIVVMNEAFSDLTIFDKLEPNIDPTPFLHSMEENTIKGWLFPPVTGGGTASVEFEFLTGLSNSFLPPHCVAYQLYMKEDSPALSSVLQQAGYHTTAFHPYRASGWNRPVVYDYLDFDRQMYNTDVSAPQYVRGYISDHSSYATLFRLTEQAQGQPTFLFNVTMQNHSGYDQGWRNLPQAVSPGQDVHSAEPKADQYLSLMKVSDQSLQELIEHYRQTDTPTMVVFFGDHQPSLSNKFYEALYGKKLSERTTREVLQQYAVPFFIWANYDIPEQEDVFLSSSFLGVLTAETAGLPMTGWMDFLSQLYRQLPVITPVGYITADGQICAQADDLPESLRQWLSDYERLCYRALMDPQPETQDFFHALPNT